MLKKVSIYCLLFVSTMALSQKRGLTPEDKEFLDSVKSCFVDHKKATAIDNKWLKQVYTEDLFEELQQSLVDVDMEQPVDYQLSTELLKKRLKKMDAKSPFNIEYHPSLENLIKHYLKNRKRSYERLMAVSEYYFPMFEATLAKYKVPLEIKYLAIVESALNPRAISRVGASGLWQFMYNTGKEYDLQVDSYVDERYDPLKATEAACQYLTNMYNIFGDWSLVLASYNAGPGNVTKAIRRSGGQTNYWNIRKNLPNETQGYLPAFLATMYVFEYHKEHGIKPEKALHNFMKTDTIVVRNKITFEQISELLDISYAELQFLNPAYKLNVVPYVKGEKNAIRLPLDKVGVFVSNEEVIYDYCRYMFDKKEKINDNSTVSSSSTTTVSSSSSSGEVNYHTVKSKETISALSRRYGVSVTDIKSWNDLSSNTINVGQRIKIYSKGTKSSGSSPKHHTVKRGETLSVIAMKYPGVTVSNLKKWNRLHSSKVQVGQKLKLSR